MDPGESRHVASGLRILLRSKPALAIYALERGALPLTPPTSTIIYLVDYTFVFNKYPFNVLTFVSPF